MGNKLEKENKEEDLFTESLTEQLKDKNFTLDIEDRNLIRKVFLKNLKKVLIIKNSIEFNIEEEDKMAKAKVDDIYIPIFDGSNYSSWEYRLLNVLEYKECNVQAEREFDATTDKDEAAWKKADLKARNILISTINNKQLEFIKGCKTTFKMLEKFKSMYSKKSTALQIICRSQVEDVKMKNYEKTEDFFVDFEQACNKFIAAGGTLDEKEKMRYLIKALPSSYSFIGSFIDLVPDAEQTVDYVKSKILEKSMTQPENEKRKNVSTINVKTRGQCHHCGKIGHFKKDSWRLQQDDQGKTGQSSQR